MYHFFIALVCYFVSLSAPLSENLRISLLLVSLIASYRAIIDWFHRQKERFLQKVKEAENKQREDCSVFTGAFLQAVEHYSPYDKQLILYIFADAENELKLYSRKTHFLQELIPFTSYRVYYHEDFLIELEKSSSKS